MCGHTQSGDLVWDSLRDLKWAVTGWPGGYQQPGHRAPLNVSLRSVRSSLYSISFFFFLSIFLSLKEQPLWSLKEWGVPQEASRGFWEGTWAWWGLDRDK